MIAVLGISHKFAPVSIREVFAFDEHEKAAFLSQTRTILQLEGMIILSTCNRMEIYFNTLIEDDREVFRLLSGELMRFKNIQNDLFPHFYYYTGEKAVEQLFKVSSGLDSLVLGEEQILVQVKDAFRNAQSLHLTDCILSRLFIKAIESGKRVRTETHIGKGAASVGHAAVELSHEILPELDTCTVLVVGAGQTGDLILQCISKRGRPSLFLANRTFEKGLEVAGKYSGTAITLAEIGDTLQNFDIVFTATSSKEHLITLEMAERAMLARKDKMQVYIDLAVPTNIDEHVKNLANVRYYGVDDLKAVVHQNVERRKTAIDHSLEIIGEVKDEFMEWLDYQNLTPTIISIKENLKSIQQAEVEGFIRHRKIKENELIEQYSEHISEKYAQKFIKKLKLVTDNGKKTEYIKVINELFELIENE